MGNLRIVYDDSNGWAPEYFELIFTNGKWAFCDAVDGGFLDGSMTRDYSCY